MDVAHGPAHALGADAGTSRAVPSAASASAGFTQNALLSPDDFVKRAGERGVRIEPAHLLELHRRRARVPLLRIVQQPPRSPTAVPVAASAAEGYTEHRTPLDLVITAAIHGRLTDPGPAPFRRWDGGLPPPVHGGIHRYPSVFYSPYQLLGVQPVQELVQKMTVVRDAEGRVSCTLDPLTREEAVALDGCRQLAISVGRQPPQVPRLPPPMRPGRTISNLGELLVAVAQELADCLRSAAICRRFHPRKYPPRTHRQNHLLMAPYCADDGFPTWRRSR